MVRGRVVLPKVGRLPPAEEDLQELLHRFEEAVFQGEPLTFATFKRLWKEMTIHFIFETRPASMTHEYFISSLYASALDCLEVPLRPRKRHRLDLGASPDPQQWRSGGAGPSQPPQGEGGWSNEATGSGYGLSLADLMGSAMGEDSQEDSDSDAEHLSRVQASLAPPPGKQKPPLPKKKATTKKKGKGPTAGDGGQGMLAYPAGQQELLSRSLDDIILPSDGLFPHLDDQAPGWEQEAMGRPPDPTVVRIGSIYLLYALYAAQPPTHNIRIYVPLSLLRSLAWACRLSREVHTLVGRLVEQEALLVGAVRRPISGTWEARVAGQATSKLLRPDRLEQQRVIAAAFVNLSTSLAAWNSLQHIQLLCNSYKKCQERLWAGTGMEVQGVFDMDTGSRLGGIARDLQTRANKLWADNGCPQMPGPPPQSSGGKQGKAVAAQPEGGEAERVTQPQAASGGPPDPAEAAKAREEAAERRRQRDRLAEEGGGGLPSMEELGLSLPGEQPVASEPEVQQARLSKGVRAVIERQDAEAREERRRMDVWNQAITGLLNDEAEADPELRATGASRPPAPTPHTINPAAATQPLKPAPSPATVPPTSQAPAANVASSGDAGVKRKAAVVVDEAAGAKKPKPSNPTVPQAAGTSATPTLPKDAPAKQQPEASVAAEAGKKSRKVDRTTKARPRGAATPMGGSSNRGPGRPKKAAAAKAAPKEPQVPGASAEEGLREQESAQTTQFKATVGREGAAPEAETLQEPQSKNAADNLAECLAEIDEFLKDP